MSAMLRSESEISPFEFAADSSSTCVGVSSSVAAEASLLQTDRSDTGIKIEEKTLANLPISTRGGRNFQSLLNAT